MNTGTIVSYTATNKTSTKTGKPFKVDTVTMSDGQSYECGFSPLKGFNPGDTVSFVATSAYGRMNIDPATVTRVGAAGAVVAATPVGDYGQMAKAAAAPAAGAGRYSEKVFPVPKTHGDRSIIRQNALTNARELVSILLTDSDKLSDEDIANRVITMAYRFEEYSSGDRELNMAKASAAKKRKAAEEDDGDETLNAVRGAIS